MPDLPKKKDFKKGLNYRTLSLRMEGGTPSTLDLDSRSVEVIGATESRVRVFDYERWEIVDEILLMSGCEIPENRQVPLLDSHYRYSVDAVYGSYRDMVIEGENLIGRAHYSQADEKADLAYEKVREGHLTDYSIGYTVQKSVWIPDGETARIDGRDFEGPVKVATRWTPRELSTCPIGADEMAKVRADGGPNNPQHLRDDEMTEKLRAILVARGLPEGATDAEAMAFMERELNKPINAGTAPAQPAAAGSDGVDVDKIRAEAAGGERARITEIDAMCGRFDCTDIAGAMIQEGLTLDEARTKVMDHVAKRFEESEPNQPGSLGHRAEVGTTDTEKFRAAATDSLLLRGDIPVEAPAAGASDLRGFTMREMCREVLQRSGVRVPSNPMEMIGRALTSEELPIILGAVANKSLLVGFETAEESWPLYCGEGSVSDFKINKTGRLSEGGDLAELGDGGEYPVNGKRDERFEEYAIASYGKIFAITRHSIINDDLNALTVIPMQHGEAATRKIGDVAAAVVTANSAMGDGVALFHATHANLAGAGAGIGTATLGAGIQAMKGQKDIEGKRRLNIKPQIYLAPTAVESASETFFKTEKWDDANAAGTRTNIYAGSLVRVYEPRLDDDSATAWYLIGRKGQFIKVFFLNGVKTPYLEVRNGWSVDGVEHKIRIDVGAKALEYRTGYKNAGA